MSTSTFAEAQQHWAINPGALQPLVQSYIDHLVARGYQDIGLLLSGVPKAAAFMGAFLVGLGMGAEVDIIAYLTSRYFGLRSFGEIYGYAFAGYVLAGALGPWLMGLGFDRTGSYNPVLAGFLLATLVAAVTMLKLGPYRYRHK